MPPQISIIWQSNGFRRFPEDVTYSDPAISSPNPKYD